MIHLCFAHELLSFVMFIITMHDAMTRHTSCMHHYTELVHLLKCSLKVTLVTLVIYCLRYV